jgi:hypothetical protein
MACRKVAAATEVMVMDDDFLAIKYLFARMDVCTFIREWK